MRNLLTLCFISFATQVSAADTVMICNWWNSEKYYYKLEAPFFGEKTVKRREDGKWVNWCREGCVEFEVYETGAMLRHEKVWPSKSISVA